ncbi:asparaginase [Ferroacidibacillus organovorans]|nr:asparaginase [Ferroacidibacillus organovorans]
MTISLDHPFRPSLLSVEFRGDVIENIHYGHVAVCNAEGQLLYSCGIPSVQVYGRSALKIIQALPLLETGAADYFHMTDRELALCASSHSGLPSHQEGVRSILTRIGCEVPDLICGSVSPYSGKARDEMVRGGEPMTGICNECSGVHAGMLATAVYCKESTRGYEDIRHPVQKRVLDAIREVTATSEARIQVGNDGCGIPTYALPLERIACGFARMTRASMFQERRASAIQRMLDAYCLHPEMVTEEDSFTTRLIRAFDGDIIGKEGAKGIFALMHRPKGLGIAIKVADGTKESIPSVVLSVLSQIGCLENLPANLDRYRRTELKNSCNDVIGQIEPRIRLQAMPHSLRR